MLNLYPTWTRVDPVFTRELLASIGYKCRTAQALDEEEQAYLAESIAKILAGVPAKRALHLSAPVGRRGDAFSLTFRTSRDAFDCNFGGVPRSSLVRLFGVDQAFGFDLPASK